MNEETISTNATEEAPKTYTAEEVDKLIQAETDRRTNQALKKQAKEYEKKLSLSQLDGDERAKAESANRIAELEEQLAQFQIEKNKSEIKSVLSSRNLPCEFADLLSIGEDVEENQQKIDSFDKLFKKAVKLEVERRLAATGSIPRANSQSYVEPTSLRGMTMAQMLEIQKNNPELWDKLNK